MKTPLLLALLLLTTGGALAKSRPNFIVICSDDQRYDCVAAVQAEQGAEARFPWLETPNLDRLGQQGMRFRNAFVVHSLCTPSRASFLTGRYTHSHGIFNNFTPFPHDMTSFASLLTKGGYSTGYIGKWHMGEQRGRRPGFTYSASYAEQGQYIDCPFEIDGETTATSGWVDEVSTDYALDFIKKNRDRDFAMVLGFKTAHDPFIPPKHLADKYDGELMGPAQNHWNLPIYLGRVHVAKPEHEKLSTATTGNRPIRDPLDYFRVITAIDEQLGRIMSLLDELGIAEDTVVVYTSDNGYHLGEHGIGDKRTAYEVSMRIPLIVRYPRMAALQGRTNDAMVLNIDLAPTLLDLAGLPVPAQMQGRTWRPLLEDGAKQIREAFLYEYFFSYGDITDYEAQTANPPITPTLVAVRAADAKIIKYPGRDWVELFDLARDPHERVNVADDSRYGGLRRRMDALYDQQIEAVGYRIPENVKPAPLEGLEDWRL